MWNITSAQNGVIASGDIAVRGQDAFDDVEARVAESVDVSGL
jgi:hypothetical protein